MTVDDGVAPIDTPTPHFLIIKLKLAPAVMSAAIYWIQFTKLPTKYVTTAGPLFKDRIVKLLNMVLNNVATSATFDVSPASTAPTDRHHFRKLYCQSIFTLFISPWRDICSVKAKIVQI